MMNRTGGLHNMLHSCTFQGHGALIQRWRGLRREEAAEALPDINKNGAVMVGLGISI